MLNKQYTNMLQEKDVIFEIFQYATEHPINKQMPQSMTAALYPITLKYLFGLNQYNIKQDLNRYPNQGI